MSSKETVPAFELQPAEARVRAKFALADQDFPAMYALGRDLLAALDDERLREVAEAARELQTRGYTAEAHGRLNAAVADLNALEGGDCS